MQNKQINKQKKSKYEKYPPYTAAIFPLTLSWRRPLSYRNQSIDWFLYDNVLRHERIKDIAIGHVHESCVNKIDTISMFQCHIKLLFYVYTSTGYICKNLQIILNYVLRFLHHNSNWMSKYGEECMFEFYKWPVSENDFVKLGNLVIVIKENRLHRKNWSQEIYVWLESW